MTCIIVDDNPIAHELLTTYIDLVPDLTLVNSFHSSLEALSWCSKEKVDLAFIDIEMPGLNGTELVRSMINPPMVVFITSHPGFAVEGFELDALDYLMKPVKLDRFLQSVQKAERRKAQQPDRQASPTQPAEEPQQPLEHQAPTSLLLKSGEETHRVTPQDITYVKANGNYVDVHFEARQKIMVLQPLHDLLNKLPEGLMVRTHRSYAINLNKVSKVERHQAWVGSEPIPVSQSFKRAFIDALGDV